VKGTRQMWIQSKLDIPSIWPVKIRTNLLKEEILDLESAGFQLLQRVVIFPKRLFGIEELLFTKRKTEINDSINDSFLSCLGLKLPINDSNNVFGFESLSMNRLCHLSRLLTRGYFSPKG
jgi:hypothetical protein